MAFLSDFHVVVDEKYRIFILRQAFFLLPGFHITDITVIENLLKERKHDYNLKISSAVVILCKNLMRSKIKRQLIMTV